MSQDFFPFASMRMEIIWRQRGRILCGSGTSNRSSSRHPSARASVLPPSLRAGGCWWLQHTTYRAKAMRFDSTIWPTLTGHRCREHHRIPMTGEILDKKLRATFGHMLGNFQGGHEIELLVQVKALGEVPDRTPDATRLSAFPSARNGTGSAAMLLAP